MRKRMGIACAIVVVLSTLTFTARADDEKVSAENLPAAVKNAIKKKFPRAEIEKAVKEVEDGKTIYEVLLEIDDKPIEVALTADGTIEEIERKIPFEQLPAPVKKALKARYPKAKIEKVEAITKGENGPTLYEIAIKAEVVLNADGKIVEDEEEEDEKPAAKATTPK